MRGDFAVLRLKNAIFTEVFRPKSPGFPKKEPLNVKFFGGKPIEPCNLYVFNVQTRSGIWQDQSDPGFWAEAFDERAMADDVELEVVVAASAMLVCGAHSRKSWGVRPYHS